jgi:hypothetical protein
MEEKIKEVIKELRDKFITEEEFIQKLKNYSSDPYYWIGYYHREVVEVHGKIRNYYIKRETLYLRAEEFKEIKKKGGDVKEFLSKLGIFPEDVHLVSCYFEGLAGI